MEPCVDSDVENGQDNSYSDHDASKEDLIIKIEKNNVSVFQAISDRNTNEGFQTGNGTIVTQSDAIIGGGDDTASESAVMATENTGEVDEGFSEESQNNPGVSSSNGANDGGFAELKSVKIDPVENAKKERSEENGAIDQAQSLKNEVLQLAKQMEKHHTTQKQMAWYSCPVCCENVTNKVLLLKHLQLHRVWILRTPEGLSANGVDAIFEALNMRMPNVPQGLTDRETGLAIEEVLISKSPVVTTKVTPVHLLNVHPTGLEELPAEQPVIQNTGLDSSTMDHTNSFEQTNGNLSAVNQEDMSTTVTIDESALRDLGLLCPLIFKKLVTYDRIRTIFLFEIV